MRPRPATDFEVLPGADPIERHHLRAHVREHHAGERARPDAGKFDDANARKRAGGAGCDELGLICRARRCVGHVENPIPDMLADALVPCRSGIAQRHLGGIGPQFGVLLLAFGAGAFFGDLAAERDVNRNSSSRIGFMACLRAIAFSM